MKTLDEVIDAMERCIKTNCFDCNGCPYEDDDAEVGCRSDDKDADALHYLKEYREMLNVRIYIPEGYTREKTGFTHQDFANTFGEEPHFIRDFMVGTSQKLRNTSQITCPKCHSEFIILPEENPALTWDELRTMEGKPVWVEALLYKQWAVIAYVGDDHIRFEGANLYAPESRIYMGEENGWQAYRKERK